MNIPALTLGTLGAAAVIYVLTRRQSTLRCDELLRRLHPHQQAGRDIYLEDLDAPNFWFATDGLRGVFYRWQNQQVFLALCQIRVLHHGLKSDELRYVTTRAGRLTGLSFLLLLLAPFYKLRSVDRLGRRAFRVYSEIADRTHSFFSADDVPVCSIRLASLL